MSGWGTNVNANRIKDTYIKGFLDISGGPLIVEKSSSLQIMAHDSDHPVIEFKPEYFTVTTTSAIDVSYSALAAIGFLGVSFENSTTDITNRVKHITAGTNFTEIGNDDEKSELQVYGRIKGHYGLEVDGDVSLNNNLFVAGDSSMNNNLSLGGNLYVAKQSVFSLDVSMNGNLSVNNDLSLNGNLYVSKRSLFTLDASFNGNTKLGSGSSSVSVNKDISSAFALDVSGSTVLRNTLYVGSDVSLNTNLYVNNDLSLNGNLYVVKRSLFTLDVSMSQNLDIGSGSNSVSINKDISSAFALDVSGSTVLRNTLYVGSDVSLNTNLYVNNDLSLNGNLYVVKRSLFTLDASFNGNTKLGSGSSSVSVNKDISSAFALDVSGSTVLRNTLYVGSDVSLNTNLYVNNDLSLNGNLYVGKRSLFTLDVSMSQNLDIGSGSNSVAINKDISSAFALDVSGSTVLRNTLYVGSDVSLNTNLYVNNDLSLNGNLYVGKRSLFTLDASFNGNTKLGSGLSSVSINKDISSAFALDVSGATILRNTLSVGSNVTIDGGSLSVANITEPNPVGDCNLWTNSTGGNINIGTQSATGLYLKGTTIDIQGGSGLPMTINTTGNFAITNSSNATAEFITGNKTVGVNIGTGNFTTTGGIMSIFTGNNNDASSKLNIGTGTTNAGEINIATGGSRPLTSNTNIGGTVNLGSATSKTSVLGIMNVTNDASLNGNVKLGSGSRSVSINKDISAGIALDVSGDTILRNTLLVGTDVSVNGILKANSITTYSSITSTSGNMSAYNMNASNVMTANSIQASTTGIQMDIATNQIGGVLNIGTETTRAGDINIGTGTTAKNIYIGTKGGSGATTLQMSGSAISIGQANTSTLNLNPNTTGSGSLNLGNAMSSGTVNMGTGMTGGTINIGNNGSTTSSTTLNIATGTNVNGPINIGNSASAKTINIGGTSTTLVLAGSSISTANDVSLNGNIKLGSGNRSVAINKDISSAFALDVSGSTVLRNTLYVGSDVSLNTNLYVNNDLSLNGNLYVGKRSLFTLDVSMSKNLDIGSGSNSVAINKDISSAFALDVSGSTVLRNTLYVGSDVSLNTNLYVNNDLSLNGNLYVVKRSVFTMDVSMIGNLDIGSGSSSFAINKDISSAFALDVSGVSQFRGNVDVSGTFTVNGAPVSGGGGSLTGNVQVGSNSGFVTINKPQFYADPSLTIYYNFDTSINGGLGIKNIASASTLYDGTFNITTGSTTGMIDTTLFYNGKQNNTSLASFENDPPSNNFGIRIGSGTVPVSSTMTFSFWLYKKSRPSSAQGDWDRVFHFTDSTSQFANENNTIALDISAGGSIFPVITKGGSTPVSLLTPSLPIVSYDLCTSVWNHVLWTINGTRSIIYINGSNVQSDTLSENITLNTSSQRNNGTIAYSYTSTTGATRDFSGNLDDFRYYNGKALTYSEIYQLYNNNFYTFDICGGFLANGSSVIYEPVGSVATANRGTLTLLHGDASGSSSIMFKSLNDPLEYAYIEYDENGSGSTGYHYGLMTIGIENDAGVGAYTAQADRISLFPSGGTGFVGVNTKTPLYSLDVSGTLNTNADASINGVSIGRGAGNVASNTAIGYQALSANTTGDTNVAVGYQALSKNSTGTQNVAIGYQSLWNCIPTTTTGYNTAVGHNTLGSVTTGTNNVAIGVNAGGSNAQTTSNNTFLGGNTSMSATNWSTSTAVGYGAQITMSNQIKLGTNAESVFCGNNLLLQAPSDNHCYIRNTTANNLYFGTETYNYMWISSSGLTVNKATGTLLTLQNTSGVYAGSQTDINFMTGTGNFPMGRISALDTSPNLGTYSSVMIFYLANGTVSTEYMRIASTGVTAPSYNATSDYRVKENVVPLDASFTVDGLNPVTYNLKSSGKQDIGFIAHEVQEFYPFLVSGEKDGKDTQSLNYNGFIGILTKEIKVLKKKVAEQEAKALEQEARILDQDQRIKALEKMMLDLINK